jgi:hypothetical protein
MTMIFDIFLSYRRNGGYATAKHLYDLLVYDGYTVSFDIDTLRSGDFDTELLKRIDECTDFVVILNKGVFDRCFDTAVDKKQDWLRNELAYAIEKKKNIVPIMLDGFTAFPYNLPADIADVARKNSPKYDQYYFDDFYRRLKETFLETPSPTPTNKKSQRKKIIVFTMLAALLFISLLLAVWKTSQRNDTDTDTTVNVAENDISLPIVIPRDANAPLNLINSVQPRMLIKNIEEHFGMAKEGYENHREWTFKNLKLEVIKNNEAKISEVSFSTHNTVPCDMPWDKILSKYGIPNFGVATFGDILDKLNYDGENVTWIGDFEYNPCFEGLDLGHRGFMPGAPSSDVEDYIRLVIGPEKATNYKTYILSSGGRNFGWWDEVEKKSKTDFYAKIKQKLISAHYERKDYYDSKGHKDFSVLTKSEQEQVLELVKSSKIETLTIKQ